MKFEVQYTGKALPIPSAALKISGFEAGDKAEFHPLPSAVILLRKRMTAMELIQAIDGLQRTVLDLITHLADVCGPCEECDNGWECPADPSRTATMIPDELREEAHIPEGAKLCAWVGDTPGTVIVGQADYRYDLTDVPVWILEILASHGICIGKLEDRLMEEGAVYG